MTPTDDPESFYDDYGHEEWERLERSLHGRLEREGTVEYLERFLPEAGRVLDAGGGAGRYAVWLAERGHDVTMVDLSAEQRAIAREKVGERDLDDRVDVREGDVRDLAFDDEAFDATLCLGGPVSHVLDAGERETAVRELDRVTAPGNPVFVSVMGRLSLLNLLLISRNKIAVAPKLAETGDYVTATLEENGFDSDFVDTHFFRRAEFEALLERGGLAVERTVGLEGLASVYAAGALRETAEDLTDDEREHVRSLVDGLREDPTVVDVSAHMLAVCRAGE